MADVIRVWTDDRGHVHYGNVASDMPTERILEAPPLPTAQEQEAARAQMAKNKERLSQWESARPLEISSGMDEGAACERAMQAVEFLWQYPELVLMRPLSSGEIAWMSTEERVTYLAAARQRVLEQCESGRGASMDELAVVLFWPRTARAQPELIVFPLPNPPITAVPVRRIKGARPGTSIPSIPAIEFVGSRPPVSVPQPASALLGSKPPTSATNPGAGSFK